MSSRWIAACLGLVAFWHGPAQADPIVYTEQAVASGSLGALDFTDSLVTISLAADTSGVAGTSVYFTNEGQATLSIGALGQAALVDPLEVFAYAGATGTILGLTDSNAGADLLDTVLSPGFAYDLTTVLAPVTGPSLINAYFPFATSAGDLDLVLAGDATVSASLQEVPEPASLPLFCGAAALLIALHARRKPITAP